MKIKLGGFKKVFHKTLGKKRGELIDPLKAWTRGLIAAVVVFIVGATLSAVDFYLQLVSPDEIVVDEKPLIYREHEVREYAELYNEKAQTFNELRDGLWQPPPPPTEEDEPDSSEEEIVAEEPIDE